MRRIVGLRSADKFEGWPPFIKKPRYTGLKALGPRYEKAVAKELGSRAIKGQWWSFTDSNGPGVCQTDLVITGSIWTVIIECKHSWTVEGMEQLSLLYLPVVEMALRKKTIGIQVCKHLIPTMTGPLYSDLEAAVEAAKRDYIYGNTPVTLHWRGVGPLLKRSKELHHGN